MSGGAEQLKRFAIALITALATAAGAAQASDKLQLLSDLTWSEPQPWFGGFSGAEVSASGDMLTLITDRGRLVTARLIRKDGVITQIRMVSHMPLRHANQSLLKGGFRDAEGLAVGPSGQAYLSFELRHRVTRLDLQTGITNRLPAHDDFARFGRNTGLEALALHPDGRLFALTETRPNAAGQIPLYLFDQDNWQLAQYLPGQGRFRPVGADFDTGGRLYLLERRLTPLGFQSRIRRIDLSVSPVRSQTLLTTKAGAFDNLEALSLWTDPSGAERLIALSDDNFLPLQRTQIIEFRLTE